MVDMRKFSTSISKSSPAIRKFGEGVLIQRKPVKGDSFKLKSLTFLRLNPPGKASIENGLTGKSLLASPFNPSSNLSVDHAYISRILSRKDWFLLLNHELKAERISLDPHRVISILQNQKNPSHPLKFYLWVTNVNPLLLKNRSVRVVLTNALYRNGPVLLSAELIQDIRDSGCQLKEDLLWALIGSWGRLGLARYCSDVFGQISYLGISPTTRLYNVVIDALVKSNSLDLAYLKFQQMPVDKCKPDRFTYNILIHGTCKAGVVDESLRLIKQMEGFGYSPNVFTYTILIDGLCNSKRIDEAFAIVEKMKERNVKPNEATYRSLVNGVFRNLPSEKALELLSVFLDKQSRLSKIACDTVLQCLSSKSMAREAVEFLRKVMKNDHLPDNATFNMVMICLIKSLDLDEVCELSNDLTKRGLSLSFNTYIALIEGLYRLGRTAEGNLYLKQMLNNRLLENVVSCNMVIDCLCKVKMMEKASETFTEMRQRGILPNLVTFNTLINGYCKVGQMDKAKRMLSSLLENGFRPDIFTFTSLIEGLCRKGQIHDAFNCFNEMVDWGVSPNAFTYNILIRSLCIIGDANRSVELLKKMKVHGISPDVFSYNALIQCYLKMNKVEKAMKVMATMSALDLTPDNFTYCAFIKSLCELGRLNEAKSLFYSMEGNGCIPDGYTCNMFVRALVQASCYEEARDVSKRYEKIRTLQKVKNRRNYFGSRKNYSRSSQAWCRCWMSFSMGPFFED